jgi:hypothetical protein
MKKMYRGVLFFSIFAAVFLGGIYAGQTIGLLPRRTFSSNLLEAAIVSIASTIFFTIWATRRQTKSAEA